MNLSGKTIGFALTGSFCTYETVFFQMQNLVNSGANVIPIFSYVPQETTCRFGSYQTFLKRAEQITGHKPLLSITQTEPIGPKGLLDLLLIAPCTGNTLAKLAHSIADGPVTMTAKSHLRNGRPVVVAVSTNDALSGAAENIGHLMGRKHYYFVPFGQDDAAGKPCSLIADFEKLPETVDAALRGEQIQPILL